MLAFWGIRPRHPYTTITVIAQWVLWVRDNRIGADELACLWQIVAGIHVDERHRIAAGVVVTVAGKASAGQVGVSGGLWLGNIAAKRVTLH